MKLNRNRAAAPLLTWGIPVIIVFSFALLAQEPDLRLAVPLLVGVAATVTILLAVALHAGERGWGGWSPAAVVAVAVVLRLFFLFSPPQLSDDSYRYLWDGLQTLAGHNPYALPPAAVPAASAPRPELVKLVNHPKIVTIYPPAAQLVFALGARLGGTITGLKALLVAVDIGVCLLLVRLLPLVGLPAWRAALYAWHPLPVLEIGGSGHIDGAGIFFLFATLVLLRGGRPEVDGNRFPGRTAVAGALFACSVLVKLFPLVYLPGLLMLVRSGARRIFLVIGAAVALLLALPFLPELRDILISLATYGKNWEFAGFAFRTLRALVSGMGARMMLGALFFIVTTALYAWLFIRRRQARTSQALPGAGPLPVMQTMYALTITFLLLTTTLHPWYALYLAALLPFAAGPAGFSLSWAVFLAYQVLIPYAILGQWAESGQVAALIWLAPAAALLLSAVAKAAATGRSSTAG